MELKRRLRYFEKNLPNCGKSRASYVTLFAGFFSDAFFIHISSKLSSFGYFDVDLLRTVERCSSGHSDIPVGHPPSP